MIALVIGVDHLGVRLEQRDRFDDQVVEVDAVVDAQVILVAVVEDTEVAVGRFELAERAIAPAQAVGFDAAERGQHAPRIDLRRIDIQLAGALLE